MRNTIKKQRAIKDMTQQDLAEALQIAPITVNAIESNRYIPSTLLALRIAKYFDKPFEEVFILEEDEY